VASMRRRDAQLSSKVLLILFENKSVCICLFVGARNLKSILDKFLFSQFHTLEQSIIKSRLIGSISFDNIRLFFKCWYLGSFSQQFIFFVTYERVK